MQDALSILVPTVGTIVVAYIQYQASKDRKVSEERAKIRARESRLSMDMMYATSKLCVGTALALKRGHANGELDDGLEMVDRAADKYQEFLREVASGQIGA